jgi:hypothetical protein
VAAERKNYKGAIRFLDYAEQYKSENQELVTFSDQTQNEITIATIQKAIDAHNNSYKETVDSTENNSDSMTDVSATDASVEEPVKTETALLQPPDMAEQQAMTTEYRRLVIDAAYYFAIGNYEQARTLVTRARELEQCHCFPVDARISVIYNSLSR